MQIMDTMKTRDPYNEYGRFAQKENVICAESGNSGELNPGNFTSELRRFQLKSGEILCFGVILANSPLEFLDVSCAESFQNKGFAQISIEIWRTHPR